MVDGYKIDLIYFVVYIVPIIILWVRMETRLSRLEGRLDVIQPLINRFREGDHSDG